MNMWTYLQAIRLAGEIGQTYISIGGGEPTVHPDFWRYLDIALEDEFIESVWLATNGKRSRDAYKLLEYMDIWSRDKFSCELSQDEFHAPISDRVIDAFRYKGAMKGVMGKYNPYIRTVTGGIIKVGRAIKTGVWDVEGCAQPGLHIDPEGKMWNCGCKQTQFGTVFNPQIPDDYWYIERYDGGCNYQKKIDYCKENNINPEDYGGME